MRQCDCNCRLVKTGQTKELHSNLQPESMSSAAHFCPSACFSSIDCRSLASSSALGFRSAAVGSSGGLSSGSAVLGSRSAAPSFARPCCACCARLATSGRLGPRSLRWGGKVQAVRQVARAGLQEHLQSDIRSGGSAVVGATYLHALGAPASWRQREISQHILKRNRGAGAKPGKSIAD